MTGVGDALPLFASFPLGIEQTRAWCRQPDRDLYILLLRDARAAQPRRPLANVVGTVRYSHAIYARRLEHQDPTGKRVTYTRKALHGALERLAQEGLISRPDAGTRRVQGGAQGFFLVTVYLSSTSACASEVTGTGTGTRRAHDGHRDGHGAGTAREKEKERERVLASEETNAAAHDDVVRAFVEEYERAFQNPPTKSLQASWGRVLSGLVDAGRNPEDIRAALMRFLADGDVSPVFFEQRIDKLLRAGPKPGNAWDPVGTMEIREGLIAANVPQELRKQILEGKPLPELNMRQLVGSLRRLKGDPQACVDLLCKGRAL